jgi:cobalamin biosynthetic protein CobC
LAAGHRVATYRNLNELTSLVAAGDVQHAVVINPNNPSAEQADPVQLLQWRESLAPRGGLLVVDEAFIDAQPQLSLASQTPLPNLVILRSFGKFFGLAGVRLGFVLAGPAILAELKIWCNPWQITHPAQWIGAQALRDHQWQAEQRRRIAQHAEQMHQLLRPFFLNADIGNSGLFLTVTDPGTSLYQRFIQFAEAQVLLRYGRSGDGEWLRFGLPGDDCATLKKRLEHLQPCKS